MKIKALRTSSAIRRRLPREPGSAHVHSVYAQVLNLIWEGGWLNLHTPSVPSNPYSIVVEETGNQESLSFLESYPGEKASVAETFITFGNRRLHVDLVGADSISFDLKSLERAEPKRIPQCLDRVLAFIKPPTESVFLHGLLFRLGIQGFAFSNQDLFFKKSCEIIDGIRQACESDNGALLRQIASAVGFGFGLTPSGDDFLTGMLAACDFFANEKPIYRDIAGAVSMLASSTTLPSFYMLDAACQGLYPETLCEVLPAIVDEDEKCLCRSLARLRSIGASSGDDMLAGIILTMNLLENNWSKQ